MHRLVTLLAVLFLAFPAHAAKKPNFVVIFVLFLSSIIGVIPITALPLGFFYRHTHRMNLHIGEVQLQFFE